MSYIRTIKSVCALTLVASTLGACVTPGNQDKINTGTFRQFDEQRNLVVFEAPQYKDATPTRVTYNDRHVIEEYTLYRAANGQSELLYVQPTRAYGFNTALDFNELIVESTRMWRFNQGQTLKFGETFLVKNDVTEFWVQPYKQIESGRECAGFSATWETHPKDRQLRPRKALFGYHCAPKGTAFGPNDAQALMETMQIRGVTIPQRIETVYEMKKDDAPPPPKDEQRKYLVLAQDGGGGGVAGIPAFPLLIAVIINDIDGGNKDS